MDNIKILRSKDFPPQLLEIPQPPRKLFLCGTLPKEHICLTVVGSRNPSLYGKDVCKKLIDGLCGYPIAIISGLAIGIDTCAHESAISANLPTVAVPGSGLDPKVLYPKRNLQLARRIIKSGGALLSEYEPHEEARSYTFPERNRIMAGLSHGVLIIEAKEKSGTLITARLALDYNRNVLAVPHPITSPQSIGTNSLIRDGATPITSCDDILEAFNIETLKEKRGESISKDLDSTAISLLNTISGGIVYDELLEASSLGMEEVNKLLSTLELAGLIKIDANSIRRI